MHISKIVNIGTIYTFIYDLHNYNLVRSTLRFGIDAENRNADIFYVSICAIVCP